MDWPLASAYPSFSYCSYFYYLAYKIRADATNYAMVNLFTSDGDISGSHDGYDGIAHGSGMSDLDYAFTTSLNDGGDNSTGYIEFYGYIDGSVSLTGYLYMGYDMNYVPPNSFTHTFAQYDINTSVASGRRFHFYWRITASG